MMTKGMTVLLVSLGAVAFGQTAPVITSVVTEPNIGFASNSVALAPGSAAVILGANLADSSASAAAPGLPVLGGVEIHLVDVSCNVASCELVAGLTHISPTRIDFVVPGIPDVTKIWRTRVVVIKKGQRYDGLTAGDRVLIDAIYLESSPNPALSGEPVTITAHLAALQGIPGSLLSTGAGVVTFMDGDTALGVVKLSNVITYLDSPPLRRYDVSFSTSKMAAGSHTIRADYSGDYNNNPRSSGTLVQSVSVPEITIWSTPNPSIAGNTVTLGVTLSPSTCTGTVTFFDDLSPDSLALPPLGTTVAESGALGRATIDGGRALWSTAAFLPGNHPVYVKYSGDSKCAPLGYGPGNNFEYRTISQTVVPNW